MLYLLAGNGSPNFGDELLVQHWIKYYREKGYKGKIIVDGKGSSATAKLLSNFENVDFISSIPRHAEGLGETYAEFCKIGIQYADDNYQKFSDVIGFHFLGGGYASANWINATRMLATVVRLGQKLSVPVVGTGLGISPFKRLTSSDEASWQYIINGFNVLECRDQESFQDISDICEHDSNNVYLGLDDAFLYPVNIFNHKGRWLHLSGFSESSIYGTSLEKSLDFFNTFDEVVFWTCSHKDNLIYKDLLQKYPKLKRWSNNKLLNDGLPIEADDFMISGRFHPHLLAARCGIDGLYSTFSKFYDTKHGMVLDLGSNFKRLEDAPYSFKSAKSFMLEQDAIRVAKKRNIADKIFKIFKI